MDTPFSWRTRSTEVLPGASLPELSDLSEMLILELVRTKRTIAVAESCTAGALASSLAGPEGACDALSGGFVTRRNI